MAHARNSDRSRRNRHASVSAANRRRAIGVAVVVLAVGGGAVGCHSAAVRRDLGPTLAADVAPPPTAAFTGDGKQAQFERGPVRAMAVAMPVSARAARPPVTTSFVPLWAEAPVATEGDFEVDVGVGLGIALPGNQDLKFKRKNAAGDLIDNLFTRDVTEHPSIVESADVEVWRTRGFLADFGLRASAVHWNTRVKANTFVDQLPGGGTSPVPPFDTLDEERLGVYLCVEKRFWLARDGVPASESPYAYLGFGGGLAHSVVTHGETNWASSLEANVGFSLPVADRLRLQIEGLFLVAHDVDLTGPNLDWQAETSGIRTRFHNYAHLDTWFLAVTIGIEYRL